MRSLVLGTAGHIDHGKTALVEALTGVNTDRLDEEKRRGITIELGFARLSLPEANVELGIIDVPGHERFVKSMVAGAGGIDLVALIIAADEGIMPQTREHFDIAQLLGVQHGLIVISKIDLVDREWLQLVEDDIRSFVRNTFLATSPVVHCSTKTGAGIDQLRNMLGTLAATVPPREPSFMRLPFDRVFTMKGFGTIVTGTLHGGSLAVGDTLEVLPSRHRGTVRQIQVHQSSVERVHAGQRTAINIAGIEHSAISRGEVAVFPETFTSSRTLDVQLRLLPSVRRPLQRQSKLLFHSGTRQHACTCLLIDTTQMLPGDEGFAQLRFDTDVTVAGRDRFVLRGFEKQKNHGHTIGGGVVLRILANRIRGRDLAGIESELTQYTTDNLESIIEIECMRTGRKGVTKSSLPQRVTRSLRQIDSALAKLQSEGKVVQVDKHSGRLVHKQVIDKLCTQATRRVTEYHHSEPLKVGVQREHLRSQIRVDSHLFSLVLARLVRNGALIVCEETAAHPNHAVDAKGSIQTLKRGIREALRNAALAPPKLSELCQTFGESQKTIDNALRILVKEQQIVATSNLHFCRNAIDDLEQRLIAFLTAQGEITAGQFKEIVGQSRKFSIPLAEYFDKCRVTLRIGDVRRLRPDSRRA